MKKFIKKYGFYIFYLIAGIILFNHFMSNFNVDAISYITVSEKYLSMNFKDAINGSWGPLLSFLLIPLLALGVNSLFAIKIILFFAGFGVLFFSKKYLNLFCISPFIQEISLYLLTVITLYFAFWIVTPDIIVVIVLLFYYLLLFSDKYKKNRKGGFLIGFIAGIGYLTKHYLFPFFLLHFIFFNIYFFWKGKNRKTILINFISALLIFAVISGVWVFLLSNKYRYPTIGTSAVSGLALNNPNKTATHIGSLGNGLLPPVNKTALSVWEDPSYLKFQKWSPFTSLLNFYHQIGISFNLFLELLMFLFVFAPPIILIVFLRPSVTFSNKYFKYSLFSVLLYSSGYLFTLIESRYIWINYILIFSMAIYLLDKFILYYELKKYIKLGIIVFSITSLLSFPIYALSTKYENYKDAYTIGLKLKENFVLKGNIASDEKWTESMFLAYYTNTRYFGELIGKKITEESLTEYFKNNLDYLVVWNSKNLKNPSIRYKTVYHDSVGVLEINIIKIFKMDK